MAFHTLAPVPYDIFNEIIQELESRPLPNNQYRKKAGEGKSAAFGFVNKRSQGTDISRLCWRRPRLYKLLLDFGLRYCPIPFEAITLNQDFAASPHRDKGNRGLSYLVAFGAYQGGELQILDQSDLSGCYNINCQPILFDGANLTHAVRPFTGHRYSLVFYNLAKPPAKKLLQYIPTELPSGWVLIYTDEEGRETLLKGNAGLPHPLKGRKKG